MSNRDSGIPPMSDTTEQAEAEAPSKMLLEWQRVRPWVAEAVCKGLSFETIEAVEQKISEGIYVFWAGENSVVITRLDDCPGAKFFTIVHVGGDVMEALENGEADLARMAAILGCDYILIEAPCEYIEALKVRGFDAAWTAMRKSVAKVAGLPGESK